MLIFYDLFVAIARSTRLCPGLHGMPLFPQNMRTPRPKMTGQILRSLLMLQHMGLVDQRVWRRSWRSFRRYSDARRQPQKQKLETSGCLPTFRFVLVREANSWRCGIRCWRFRSCVRSEHAACWERSCGEILSRLVDCVIQLSWRAFIEIYFGYCSPLRKFAFGAFWKCSLTCLCGSSRRKKVAQLFIGFVFFFDSNFDWLFFPTADDTMRYKWGECKCGYSMCPWVYKSGRFQGQLRLVCRGFFKQSSDDGKPACWESVEFPMSRYREISQNLKFV